MPWQIRCLAFGPCVLGVLCPRDESGSSVDGWKASLWALLAVFVRHSESKLSNIQNALLKNRCLLSRSWLILAQKVGQKDLLIAKSCQKKWHFCRLPCCLRCCSAPQWRRGWNRDSFRRTTGPPKRNSCTGGRRQRNSTCLDGQRWRGCQNMSKPVRHVIHICINML